MRIVICFAMVVILVSCRKHADQLPPALQEILDRSACDEGCNFTFYQVELDGKKDYYHRVVQGTLCDGITDSYYHSDGRAIERNSELHIRLINDGVKLNRKWECNPNR